MAVYMTKVNIFSGFLGAGKTTLIKKLLQDGFAKEKIVLIENEFGEIGIDGGFLSDAGVEITEMNSGCICCSLVGDFGKALKEVIATYSPDRIIIEPSGVGKLSDVIKAVEKVKDEVELTLDTFVTVADATKSKMYMKNFGEFYNNQIEYAKTIFLSRTKGMKQEKLEEVVHLIKEKNQHANIVTTPWDELSGEQLLEAMGQGVSLANQLLEEEEVCPTCGGHHHHDHDHEHHHHDGECCGHDHNHEHHHHDGECCGHDHDHEHHHHDGECCGHDHDHEHHHHDGECCGHDHDHHHHHADDVFTSWGVETPKKFTKAFVEQVLKTLSETSEYGTILRAKGMLPQEDGEWIYFDLVPGEYELRSGKPDYTGRLCVIGTNLQEEKLEELFGL